MAVGLNRCPHQRWRFDFNPRQCARVCSRDFALNAERNIDGDRIRKFLVAGRVPRGADYFRSCAHLRDAICLNHGVQCE